MGRDHEEIKIMSTQSARKGTSSLLLLHSLKSSCTYSCVILHVVNETKYTHSWGKPTRCDSAIKETVEKVTVRTAASWEHHLQQQQQKKSSLLFNIKTLLQQWRSLQLIGLAFKAASFLKNIIEGDAGNKKLDELKESMEQVKKGISDIQNSIDVVLSEVNWSEIITVLNEGVSYIEYSFDRMLRFNKGDEKNVKAFLDTLKLDEISEALHSFNAAMMGEYTLITGGPLMKLFVDRLAPLGFDKLPQSKRFIAADYLLVSIACACA